MAYYSKKLNKAQLNYTTMEQEMLSIVMTLKEFRSMLLGADIHIHTDHKNLTFENLQTQRVLRWRAYLEEYSPTLHYIEGPKNVIADTFSRLHRQDETPVLEGKNVHIAPNVTRRPSLKRKISNDTNTMQDAYYSILEDKELVECFLALPNEECYLNLPFEEVTENPLNLENMREKQYADTELLSRKEKYPDRYITKQIGHVRDLICYVKPGEDRARQWKIALPKSMIKKTIKWFHLVTCHPGVKRLRLSLQVKYYHPELRSEIDKFRCVDCQKHKLDGRGYGLLPE